VKSKLLINYFGENKPCEDFGRRSLRGGLVSIGATIFNAFVQMASVVVLARLLSPEDYGLVSMVGAIIGIAPLLMDLGTRDAVIQQRCISPEEISALFWITLALGCGFAAAGAIGVGKVVAVVGPQTVGALAAVATGFALRDTVFASVPTVTRATLLIISYSAAYAVIVVGLFRVRTPLRVGRSLPRAYVA
jgi:O-antigen/teichoic acid export membrane protein